MTDAAPARSPAGEVRVRKGWVKGPYIHLMDPLPYENYSTTATANSNPAKTPPRGGSDAATAGDTAAAGGGGGGRLTIALRRSWAKTRSSVRRALDDANATTLDAAGAGGGEAVRIKAGLLKDEQLVALPFKPPVIWSYIWEILAGTWELVLYILIMLLAIMLETNARYFRSGSDMDRWWVVLYKVVVISYPAGVMVVQFLLLCEYVMRKYLFFRLLSFGVLVQAERRPLWRSWFAMFFLAVWAVLNVWAWWGVITWWGRNGKRGPEPLSFAVFGVVNVVAFHLLMYYYRLLEEQKRFLKPLQAYLLPEVTLVSELAVKQEMWRAVKSAACSWCWRGPGRFDIEWVRAHGVRVPRAYTGTAEAAEAVAAALAEDAAEAPGGCAADDNSDSSCAPGLKDGTAGIGSRDEEIGGAAIAAAGAGGGGGGAAAAAGGAMAPPEQKEGMRRDANSGAANGVGVSGGNEARVAVEQAEEGGDATAAASTAGLSASAAGGGIVAAASQDTAKQEAAAAFAAADSRTAAAAAAAAGPNAGGAVAGSTATVQGVGEARTAEMASASDQDGTPPAASATTVTAGQADGGSSTAAADSASGSAAANAAGSADSAGTPKAAAAPVRATAADAVRALADMTGSATAEPQPAATATSGGEETTAPEAATAIGGSGAVSQDPGAAAPPPPPTPALQSGAAGPANAPSASIVLAASDAPKKASEAAPTQPTVANIVAAAGSAAAASMAASVPVLADEGAPGATAVEMATIASPGVPAPAGPVAEATEGGDSKESDTAAVVAAAAAAAAGGGSARVQGAASGGGKAAAAKAGSCLWSCCCGALSCCFRCCCCCCICVYRLLDYRRNVSGLFALPVTLLTSMTPRKVWPFKRDIPFMRSLVAVMLLASLLVAGAVVFGAWLAARSPPTCQAGLDACYDCLIYQEEYVQYDKVCLGGGYDISKVWPDPDYYDPTCPGGRSWFTNGVWSNNATEVMAQHGDYQNVTGKALINGYLGAIMSFYAYPDGFDSLMKGFEGQYIKRFKQLFTEYGLIRYEFIFQDDTAISDTQFIIAGTGNDVYVIFRGTDSLADALLTDLRGRCVDNVDYGAPTCVHNGFLSAYRQAQAEVYRGLLTVINSLGSVQRTASTAPPSNSSVNVTWDAMQGQPFSLWLTGHSLGGALATLSAMDLRNKGLNISGVFTYGSPRVGDTRFRDLYDSYGLDDVTWRYVHRSDTVTQVPPTSFGFVHVTEPYMLMDGRCTIWPDEDTCAQRGVLGGCARSTSDHYLSGYLGSLRSCIVDARMLPNCTEAMLPLWAQMAGES